MMQSTKAFIGKPTLFVSLLVEGYVKQIIKLSINLRMPFVITNLIAYYTMFIDYWYLPTESGKKKFALKDNGSLAINISKSISPRMIRAYKSYSFARNFYAEYIFTVENISDSTDLWDIQFGVLNGISIFCIDSHGFVNILNYDNECSDSWTKKFDGNQNIKLNSVENLKMSLLSLPNQNFIFYEMINEINNETVYVQHMEIKSKWKFLHNDEWYMFCQIPSDAKIRIVNYILIEEKNCLNNDSNKFILRKIMKKRKKLMDTIVH